jgi:hypothetical protein
MSIYVRHNNVHIPTMCTYQQCTHTHNVHIPTRRILGVIPGFSREVNEICGLLVEYITQRIVVNSLLTFRYNLSAPSLEIKKSEFLAL